MKPESLNELTQRRFQEAVERRHKRLEANEDDDLFDHDVTVTHQDGSTFHFRYASTRTEGEFLMVFSEHNGAMGFHRDDLEKVETKKSWPEEG
jgi:hypothetical protein